MVHEQARKFPALFKNWGKKKKAEFNKKGINGALISITVFLDYPLTTVMMRINLEMNRKQSIGCE